MSKTNGKGHTIKKKVTHETEHKWIQTVMQLKGTSVTYKIEQSKVKAIALATKQFSRDNYLALTISY